MTTRRLAAIVALVACGIVIAGCGGTSSRLSASDYKAHLTALSKEADRSHVVLDKALRAKTVTEIATAVAVFAGEEEWSGDQVAKLRPPRDADSANTLLARGLHDLAHQIRILLPHARKQPTAKTMIAFLNKHLADVSGGREADEAISELVKLGYTTAS